MSFNQALDLIISPVVEGNVSRISSDPGNWTGGQVGKGQLLGTKNGISAFFLWSLSADSPFYRKDPTTLTPDEVAAIYKQYFWDIMQLDELSPAVAGIMFDCAVNQGQGWAPKCLQMACGVTADGFVGTKTIAAAKAMDQTTLLANIGWLRDLRYHTDPQFYTDGHGWIVRLFRITASVVAFT